MSGLSRPEHHEIAIAQVKNQSLLSQDQISPLEISYSEYQAKVVVSYITMGLRASIEIYNQIDEGPGDRSMTWREKFYQMDHHLIFIK